MFEKSYKLCEKTKDYFVELEIKIKKIVGNREKSRRRNNKNS